MVNPTPFTRRPHSGNGYGQFIIGGDDFVQQYEPPNWLIEGIVQKGRLVGCTSMTAHGKTAVWLYCAWRVQTGRKIAGLDVDQGNVLYLAGENPDDLRARMVGMKREMDMGPGELPDVLPVQFKMDVAEIEALIPVIDELGPYHLIIADTAASFSPVDDEINNSAMGDYARSLRKFTQCKGNPTVLVQCHPIKHAHSQEDLLPRGGGAFLNELDTNLTLWSDDITEGVTTLHWYGKIRGPSFEPLPFRMKQIDTGHHDKHNRPITTVMAEPMGEVEVIDKAKQKIADENGVLKALTDHPDWSQRDIAMFMGWKTKKGEPAGYMVNRTIHALQKKKLVDNLQGFWQATDRGSKVLKVHAEH